MQKPTSPENRIQRIVTIIGWSLLLLLVIGCGPSGRDLSDSQWLELQQNVQDERMEIGRQRDLLERDRSVWNEREHNEPIIAAVISSAVLLFCCSPPLLLVGRLLRSQDTGQDTDAVCNVLLDEVIYLNDASPSEAKRIDASQTPSRLASREP